MFTADVAPLLSPVNYPLLRVTWHRLQEYECFLKMWVIAPILRQRLQVFPTGWSHNKLKAIWRIVWQQTFYHNLFSFAFFCFFLCFCLFLVKEQRWPTRVVVILDLLILLGKKTAEWEVSMSIINYRTMGRLKMKKLFAFSFLGLWFGDQSDRN